MSRIGKNPVIVDKAVQVNIAANIVTVKGAKHSLSVPVRPEVKVEFADGQIVLKRKDDSRTAKSLHGLYRALLQNAVTGVTKGFTRTLILNGVGYRAAVKGRSLELSLGFSHPIEFAIPAGIEIAVDKQTTINITGPDKGLVGQVAAKIRSFREPEPYLGKGIRYSDETIRRKAGKSAGK